jgi:bifunctional non-homologous end joining protein LigD
VEIDRHVEGFGAFQAFKPKKLKPTNIKRLTFSFIQPMLALPVRDLPVGNWLYEIKFDGYRALAIKVANEVRLISRNRKSFNDDYPVLIDSLKLLKTKSFTIDGEITALDENGRSSFQLLQGYGKAKHTPLVYYAFDLRSLDSADLCPRPLIERRKLLAKLLKNAPENIKFSEELTGTKEELLRVAKQFQLEGLIAKRPDSLYEPGRRSGAWVKVKFTQQQEFVIGGYTPPEGSRKYFGALLVGYYGPKGLLFAVELVPAFPKELWRPSMMASRRSGVRCALSSTCLRELEADGDWVSPLQS